MRNKIFQEVLDETPKEVEIFVQWHSDLVLRINRILKRKGMTQKALAEKMGKTPAEISRWLNGEHNFTLKSLAKLEAELGEPLLKVANEHPVAHTPPPSEAPTGPNVQGLKALAILLPLLQRQRVILASPQDWKQLSIHPDLNNVG